MKVRLIVTALASSVLILAEDGCANANPRVAVARDAGRDPAASATIDLRAPRLQVVLAHKGHVYAIEDHFVYASADTGRSYKRLGKLHKSSPRSVSGSVRETIARRGITRLLRQYEGPKGMLVLESGTMIVFYDHIYRSDDGGESFHAIDGTESSMVPRGFPSSVGYATGPADTVYFGEYTTTKRPHETRIIRGTDDGRRWEVAFTFPSGEVFHVHSVTYDPYRRGFWVATGDEDHESRLMFTNDHFQTLQTIGCCSQDWRLVDMIATEDALYWGSDDDRKQPGIFRYDVESRVLERVANIDNPSYHAARLSNGMLAISTTYEPRSQFTTKMRPPAATSLWLSTDGRLWSRALILRADSVQAAAGRRAQLQIPSGDPLPALFATPWFTSRDAFVTLRLDLER